jgi:tetratricopeptide (TPR) repeat protein
LVAGNRSAAERSYAQGFKAQQTSRFVEAMQAYQQAVQHDPTFYDAYYNLALAASQAGSLDVSLSAYETALVLKPESADARYNFALLLQQSNYPLDAAGELQRILATHPAECRAHLALGNLYSQQFRQADKARPHYLKVLETDPRNPQAARIRDWLAQNPG